MNNELFSFFSERYPEMVAYVKRGTISGTASLSLTPDVDIEKCTWRCYAKDSNGWVSDVSPRYDEITGWGYALRISLSSLDTSTNTLNFNIIPVDSKKEYIIIGLWD